MAALAPVLRLFPVLIKLAHTAEKDLLSLPVFAACQAVKLDGLPEGSKRPWGALAMHRAAKQNPAQLWCAQPLSGVVPWQLGLVGSPKPSPNRPGPGSGGKLEKLFAVFFWTCG